MEGNGVVNEGQSAENASAEGSAEDKGARELSVMGDIIRRKVGTRTDSTPSRSVTALYRA